MNLWKPDTVSRIVVDESLILENYVDDFHRHALMDGRSVEDSLALAEIDAGDRLTAMVAAS